MSTRRRRVRRATRAEARNQRAESGRLLRRAEGVLGEIRSALNVKQVRPHHGRPVEAEFEGTPVRVSYTGVGGDMMLPPDKQHFNVRVGSRWTRRRISIRRRTPIVGDRAIARLDRRLRKLSPARRTAVIQLLSEIPDPITLKRSHVWSSLPATATAEDILERIRTLQGFLHRAAGLPDSR
jgi:hypothetical protein